MIFTYPNPPSWSGNSVVSCTFLGYGGEVDWSPDGTKIAFDRRDEDGIYQLFTINPDGTGEVCISDPPGTNGPSATLHHGWPAYHPSGNYIVCQVEHGSSPGFTPPNRYLTEPGRGWWNNVWVCTDDGSEWWQLLNYPLANNNGVLVPRFSPDGTKLLWARKIGGVTGPAPLAQWDLQIADFTTPGGVPTISNVTSLTPGGKIFFEAHGFNGDSDRIMFCSNSDTYNLHSYDIFTADLDGSNLTNLTNGEGWEEHAHYAKHGDYIAYMSSKPYPTYEATEVSGLKSETYVMDANGDNKRRLTGFNIPGYAEYDAEPSVATSVSWNPTGTQLVVCQMSVGASYDTIAGRRMWIITLNEVYA